MVGTKPWPEVPVGNKDHANAVVLIIGAGISGMCTAIDLLKRNKCQNFIIVEKSSGVGGISFVVLFLRQWANVCHNRHLARQQISRLLL